MRIVWSPQSLRDLNAIREYIANDSERYADLTVARIFSAVERLLQFPRSGRIFRSEMTLKLEKSSLDVLATATATTPANRPKYLTVTLLTCVYSAKRGRTSRYFPSSGLHVDRSSLRRVGAMPGIR